MPMSGHIVTDPGSMSDLAICTRGACRTMHDAKLVIQDVSPRDNIDIQNAEGG